MASQRQPGGDRRITTVAPASSGVSWSVNIPQLADLVLRFGAEGLKRLQLSGIDIHTIGCILQLGEITPASVEYRSRLQATREMQRAKTWWINNALQYGCGVNFVVDELLKTRAGENVLALMTATSSILEGSDIEFLNLLYNKYDPGMQNTPSTAQLERLRSICLPLARAMDFKDRLAEIHGWLVTQTAGSGFAYHDSAIPTTTTLVQLVEVLKDISVADPDHRSRLVFYGLEGAAWLILYAKNILGLAVCMVLGNSHTVPLSGDFKTADILVFPEASDTTDVFKKIEKAVDVIVLTNDDSGHSARLSTNWLLSCDADGVDFFALMCRWDMKHRQEVGDVIFSIAAEYVEKLVGIDAEHGSSVIRYHAQDLPSKLDALRQILHLLGLPAQLSRHRDWRDIHFKNLVVDGQQRTELALRLFLSMLHHPNDKTHRSCSHVMLQPPELPTSFSVCVRCHLYDVIREIAFFSSSLVFSDWHLGLRKVSHRRLSTGGDYLSQEAYKFFHGIYQDRDGQNARQSPRVRETIPLAEHLTTICSGSEHSMDVVRSNQHKFLGLDIDGILMINYRAVEHSLRPGPVFLLRDGEFSLHGERRSLLIASSMLGSSSFGCEVKESSELRPFNHFPNANLSLNASLQREAIRLKYTFSFEGYDNDDDLKSLEIDIPVLAIADGLNNLYTTPSCSHGYKTPLAVTMVRLREENSPSFSPNPTVCFLDAEGKLWQVRDTLTCDRRRTDSESAPQFGGATHLYPVDNNPIAAWASVALAEHQTQTWKHPPVRLLQQRACLSCTRAYAQAVEDTNRGQPRDIFIISAGEV